MTRTGVCLRVSAVAGLVLALGMPSAARAADRDTRLADAAMKRDMAAVRALLQQKVDVNAPGRDGTPALHWIVRVDDLETTSALLRAGADAKLVTRYGVTPLALAASNGNAAMITAAARRRRRRRTPSTAPARRR